MAVGTSEELICILSRLGGIELRICNLEYFNFDIYKPDYFLLLRMSLL